MSKKLLLVTILFSLFQSQLFSETFGDFEYSITDNEVTITNYIGKEVDLVIPAEVNNLPVSTIADRAFSNSTSLLSITISRNISSIGNLYISHNHGLQAINVSHENQHYTSRDGVLFDKAMTTLICYPRGHTQVNYTVPSGVAEIGIKAFSGRGKLISVTMPNSVIKIGEYAFDDSLNLTSVKLGLWVNTIEKRAFNGCRDLASITLPNNITSISDEAFGGCSSLTSIVIPNKVTSIGNNAFRRCTSLSTVVLPNNLLTIGNEAFYNCTSLSAISIPNSISIINQSTFYSCTSLSNITLPRNLSTISQQAFHSCTSLSNITLPSNLSTIGQEAFYNCTSLSSISLSNSISIINQSAFQGCTSLASVTIESNKVIIGEKVFTSCDSLQSVTIGNTTDTTDTTYNNISSIGKASFYDCSALSLVTFPNSLISIGEDAFYNCESLTSLVIPDSVDSIGDQAFYNCESLVSMTVGKGVSSIGRAAFYDCSSLKTIKLPHSMTKLESELFRGCSSLNSITLPKSIISIEDNVFSYCSSLSTFKLTKNIQTIGNYVFSHCTSLVSFTFPTHLSTVNRGTFSGCNSLTSIILHDNITSIQNKAFTGCSSLVSITIPDSVLTLEEFAFNQCTSLTDVQLGEGITILENHTFRECESLRAITLPKNLTTIKSPFNHCDSLISITIPNTITSINRNPFYGSDNLESIFVYNSQYVLGHEFLTPIIKVGGAINFNHPTVDYSFIQWLSYEIDAYRLIKSAIDEITQVLITGLDSGSMDISNNMVNDKSSYSYKCQSTAFPAGNYQLEIHYKLNGRETIDKFKFGIWELDSLNSGLTSYLDQADDQSSVNYAASFWQSSQDSNFALGTVNDSSPFLATRRFMNIPENTEIGSEILVNISLKLKDDEELPNSIIVNELIPIGCSLVEFTEASPVIRGSEHSIYMKTRTDSVSWLLDQPMKSMSFDYKLMITDAQFTSSNFTGTVETVEGTNEILGCNDLLYDGTREWSVVLESGWNLISVPFALDIEFGDLYDHAMTIWTWETETNCYKLAKPTDNLEIGQGFWVYSETTQSFVLDGNNISKASISTKLGWNLIGPIKDCDFGLNLFKFNNNYYQQVEKAEPGKGYWHFQMEPDSQDLLL